MVKGAEYTVPTVGVGVVVASVVYRIDAPEVALVMVINWLPINSVPVIGENSGAEARALTVTLVTALLSIPDL